MPLELANARPDQKSMSPNALVRNIAVLVFMDVLLLHARAVSRACPFDEAVSPRVPQCLFTRANGGSNALTVQ